MKLAEALILRAACQTKVESLTDRIQRNAQVQEGDEPSENPQDLIGELDAAFDDLARLIQQINKTNARTSLQTGTLADALAERDTLKLKYRAYNRLVQRASEREHRYSRSEIRMVPMLNVSDLQRQVDALAQRYRILDSQIQALNWEVDLLEE